MGNSSGRQDSSSEFECTLCLIQNKNTNASSFCTVCQVLLCPNCVEYHQELEITKSHVITDNLENVFAGQTLAKPGTMCMKHPDKTLEKYCPKHEQIGCSKCMEETHKTCKKKTSIPTTVKAIADSKEMTKVKEDMDQIKKTLALIQGRRNDDKARLENEKQRIFSTIDELKERIMKIVENVETSSKQSCENNYQECTVKIGSDLNTCSELMKVLETMTTAINEEENNIVLFSEMKRAKQAIAVGVSLLNSVLQNIGTERLTFTVDPTVEQFLGNINTFGHINEGKYTATLIGSYDVGMTTDAERVRHMLYGAAVLQDGRVVVSDVSNGKLKILSPAYKMTSHVQLVGTPCGVCISGDMEVAVCIYDKCMIQLLQIQTPVKRLRQIKTGIRCRGVASYSNKLFVTCQEGDRNELKILTKSGNMLRSIYDDKYGNPIFSNINQIAVSPDGTRIMVTDPVKGIISFSMNGELLAVVNSGDVVKPNGITFKTDGEFFVSGFSSNNIVHFGADGKKIAIMLQERDGLMSPVSLCMVGDKSIIVTSAESKVIQVYQLKDKI